MQLTNRLFPVAWDGLLTVPLVLRTGYVERAPYECLRRYISSKLLKRICYGGSLEI